MSQSQSKSKSKSPKSKSRPRPPAEEEIRKAKAARQAKNIGDLRDGYAAAKLAFETEAPTIEMAIGCAQLASAEVEDIPSVMKRARKIAAKYGLPETSDAFECVDLVLRLDDEGEDAEQIAREAFDTTNPTAEMIFGVAEMLDADVPADIVPAVVSKAIKIRDKLGGAGVEDVFAVAEVLASEDDEDAESHLQEAHAEAVSILGSKATAEDAVSVYWQIYGEPEEDFE